MSTFAQVSKEHVRRLNRLIDQGGVRRLRRLYQQAQAELERKIARLAGRSKNTFTAVQHQVMLAQLRSGQVQIMRRLAEASKDSLLESRSEALEGIIRDIKRMERKFAGVSTTLPIEEAARFAGVLDKGKASLLRQSKASMSQYGGKLISKLEQELALSLATGETVGTAVDRISKVTDKSWWQAERIVRTEHAWAANSAHVEAIADSKDAIPDMMMRWVEHVDDDTRQKLDDRVGTDSIAMHGQLAVPGGRFTMPVKANVHPSLWGKSWSHPPNRPNDRATLQPWRPHWGIPGWVLRGGRRRYLARRKSKR